MEKKRKPENTDGKGHGLLGGTVSAVTAVAVCLVFILGAVGIVRMCYGTGLTALAVLFYILVPAVIAVGVVIALVQRWKEVRDGEEDEARKY